MSMLMYTLCHINKNGGNNDDYECETKGQSMSIALFPVNKFDFLFNPVGVSVLIFHSYSIWISGFEKGIRDFVLTNLDIGGFSLLRPRLTYFFMKRVPIN